VRLMTNTCECGAAIGSDATRCRVCAQDVNVKYTPTLTTIWSEALARRLVESEGRGGTFCATDEDEKRFRLAQAQQAEEVEDDD
jgi:hypothetical protein